MGVQAELVGADDASAVLPVPPRSPQERSATATASEDLSLGIARQVDACSLPNGKPLEDADVRRWWRKWMVRLQRHPCGEDLEFRDLDELNDLGRLLIASGSSEDLGSCDQADKRHAVGTLLGQHFRARWRSTPYQRQHEELGTSAWQAGLDRPIGNLPMPGAELDADRLRAIGVNHINAASIPSFSVAPGHPKEGMLLPHYVATQHPMPSTVEDFWRMVLVERPACIVMLNGFDYSKVGDGNPSEACAPYWSAGVLNAASGLALEELDVHRINNHGVEDVVRTLRISLRGQAFDADLFPNGMTHEVRHICVSWWQDQRSPGIDQFVYTWCLLQELLLQAVAASGDDSPRVVIHCAGGIGRVGVLIAADVGARALVTKSGAVAGEGAVGLDAHLALGSPDALIRYLRSRRVNMVQSEEQYFFLHYAIMHLVKLVGLQQSRIQSTLVSPLL